MILLFEFSLMNALELSLKHFWVIMLIFMAYIGENVLITILSGKAVYPDMTWDTVWSFVIPLIIIIASGIIYAVLSWVSKRKTKWLMK